MFRVLKISLIFFYVILVYNKLSKCSSILKIICCISSSNTVYLMDLVLYVLPKQEKNCFDLRLFHPKLQTGMLLWLPTIMLTNNEAIKLSLRIFL